LPFSATNVAVFGNRKCRKRQHHQPTIDNSVAISGVKRRRFRQHAPAATRSSIPPAGRLRPAGHFCKQKHPTTSLFFLKTKYLAFKTAPTPQPPSAYAALVGLLADQQSNELGKAALWGAMLFVAQYVRRASANRQAKK
jgi:hypothetical protein